MKNFSTCCFQLLGNTFSRCAGNTKAFLVLLLFTAVSHYGAKAQTPPPACNIVGPLTACATSSPANTANDFYIYIEVAASTAHSTISYSFESNSSGAFIREDLHGTILVPQGTQTGLTTARANGVYDSTANYTYDTLVVFPGTSGYGFNLQVNDTTLNPINNNCECSKSVSVADVYATVSYPSILCYGGNTTLTVNSYNSSNGIYTDSLYLSGHLTVGEPNPDSGTATFPDLNSGNYLLSVYSPTDMCQFDTTIDITQPTYHPLVLSCPASETVASCQTQAAVDAEFLAWLNTVTSSGGTNVIILNNYNSDNGIPSLCGGSVTITFTASSSCDTTQSCSATFAVAPAPALTLTAPANDTVAACQTQDQVNAAFAAWLNSFSYSGGCNATASNNNTGAPAACGGSTTVDFTVNSSCANAQTVNATFTVIAAPALTLTAPANDTVASCQTQAQVNAEFASWLATFGYAGGCNASASNNNSGAPAACGGSTTVDFTVASSCLGNETVSATFTVPAAPSLTLITPSNNTVASCQTQAAVNAEFSAWLGTFSYSGGCSPTSGNDNTGAPLACGGSTTVNFTVSDICENPHTVSATFAVPASPSISLTAPANDTVASCQTQAQVNAEFAAWLATFSYSGGCSPAASNDNSGAPAACGGSTTVNFSVSDICSNIQTVSATFAVPSAPAVSLTAPANVTEASCQTQGAVDAEFTAWMASASASGGCGTFLSNNYNTDNGYPAACGGSITVSFTASSNCQAPVSALATFTVPAAAALTLNAPANDTVASCQSQDAINAEFAAWLNSVSYNGGCNASLSNDNSGAPAACGGSTTVDFTLNSTCANPQTVSATFTVPAAPSLSLTAPANDTVASCQSQAQVNAEFAAFLAQFTYSGGCNVSASNGNPGAPSACGGSTTVTYTVTGSCAASQTASATFTVPSVSPALVMVSNDTVASCQTQAQINAEFNAWLNSALANGGCISQVTNDFNSNIEEIPSFCGGSVTVNFTITSSCSGTQTISASFVVPSAPDLVISIQPNDTVQSCQTQAAVNAEYAAWFAGFSVTGGCNTNVNVSDNIIPSACGGSTDVFWIISSSCEETEFETSFFTVRPNGISLVVNFPANDIVAACQSQAQVNAEFAAWLATFTYSGGCSPVATNNNTGAPSACGGATTVAFTISDVCGGTQTVSATFTVTPPQTLVLNAPANETVASCQTQATVNAEFTAWLNSASTSGGCGTQLINNYNTDNGYPAACGGSITVTFTASSNCQAPVSISATFTVPAPPSLSLTAPANDTVASCQTQAQVNAEFATWLTTFSYSGGCNPSASNNHTSAPSACGGSATVTFTVTDRCEGTQSVSAIFTVTPTAPLALYPPLNDTVASCQSQSQVDLEFVNWLATASASGGCGAYAYNDYDIDFDGAPSRCGQSITIEFLAISNCACMDDIYATATFTVKSPNLVLNAPANDTVASCQSQGQVNAEFAAWLNTFSYTGGCGTSASNDNHGAPDACGGSTTVHFTVTSEICTAPQTVSATFTVPSPAPVTLSVANTTVASCQSQAAVDAEFNAWIASASASGGCGVQINNSCSGNFGDGNWNDGNGNWNGYDGNNDGYGDGGNGNWDGDGNYGYGDNCAPSACGGSVTMTFTASSNCQHDVTRYATFTVTPAPTLTLSIANDVVASCQTQDAVNAEFYAWLASVNVSGGCGTYSSNDWYDLFQYIFPTPSACGDDYVVYFYAQDNCGQYQSQYASFIVPFATPVVLNVPANETAATCQTQAAVDSEFNAWLASANADGGCGTSLSNDFNPADSVNACGGSVTVTFTVTSNCQAPVSQSATFSVPPLVLNVPANITVASCQNQAEVDSEFLAWLGTASASGGCDPIAFNDYDANFDGTPAHCGGSITIGFLAVSNCSCMNNLYGSATFTVTPSPVIINAPANETVASCQKQDQVNAEYAAWFAGFTYSGGCSPIVTINNSGAPSSCGGSTTVDLTVFDSCSGTQTVSATFTVPSVAPLSLSAPGNAVVASCQTQDAVNAEFNAWLASASISGGCDSRLHNSCNSGHGNGGYGNGGYGNGGYGNGGYDGNGGYGGNGGNGYGNGGYGGYGNGGNGNEDNCAPSACGGSVTITFTAKSNCQDTSASATFTVSPAPTVILNAPHNKTVASCQPQYLVDAEYAEWLTGFGYSGGCNASASNDNTGAPAACGGSTTVDLTVTDICAGTQTVSATFTVTPAPTLTLNISNDVVASCQSQEAVNAEFYAWLASVNVSGGCGTYSSNDWYDLFQYFLNPPSACGDNYVVYFYAQDNCGQYQYQFASFIVPSATPVVLNAPANDTVASCQSQAQVNAAFNAWLASANVSGGCGTNLTNSCNGNYGNGNWNDGHGNWNGYGGNGNENDCAPSACGGSVTINFTASSNCQDTVTASATFTVNPAPVLTLSIANDTVASCQSQDAVNAEFYAWLASVNVNGGCGTYSSNDWYDLFQYIFNPPSACGAEYIVFFYAQDNCGQSQSQFATFVVPSATPVALNTPANDTVASCQSQDQVDAEFSAWMSSASVSGGCNTHLSNSCRGANGNGYWDGNNGFWFGDAGNGDWNGGNEWNDNGGNDYGDHCAPSACGGSTTITWTVSSSCQDTVTQSATFIVNPAPALTLSIANDTVASCQTQDAVNAEFYAWLASVNVSGGCGTYSSNDWYDLFQYVFNPPSACGDNYAIFFYAQDNCGQYQAQFANFVVPSSAAVINALANDTVASCQTQDQVNAEYSAWLAGFNYIGGCNPSISNDNAGAPLACGGSTTVDITVTDVCTGTQTYSATFTVATGPVLTMGACSSTNLPCFLGCQRNLNNTGSVSAGAIIASCGPVSYTWVDSATSNIVGTTATVTGLSTGTYYLTATDNCNSTTCSATISAPPAMTMGQCTSINMTCNINCNVHHSGGSVSAGAIANNVGPVSYTWVNDTTDEAVGTTATVTGLPAGSYTLTASDSCSTLTCTVTITQPPAMTMGQCTSTGLPCNSSCKRYGNVGSVSAGVINNNIGTVSYIWLNDANDEIVGTTATVTGLPAGNYTLTVSDSCSTLTCTETVSQPPVMTMGQCSSTNTSCHHEICGCSDDNTGTGSVTAGVITNNVGPVSYVWTNDTTDEVVGTTATVTGLPAGSYTLSASDSCSTLYCVEVVNQPLAMTMGECSATNLSCHQICGCPDDDNGSVSAGVIENNNGAVSYTWVNESTFQVVGTTSTVTGLPAGTYTLVASDSCSSLSCTATISAPPALVMGSCSTTTSGCLDSTGSVTAGEIISSNGSVSYIWVNDANNEPIGSTATISGLPAGTYTLTVSDSCYSITCQDTVYCSGDRVDNKANRSNISSTGSGFDVTVYPNPFADKFNVMIQSQSTGRIDMKIMDITGQVVVDQNDVPANNEIKFGDQFSAGVYFVEVTQGANRQVIRLIKAE